ncbi:MAG: hypothetical protein JWR69_4735 [Pedosphaera sp.]|nr:hypothetical protein [Pedosphaera sp.]
MRTQITRASTASVLLAYMKEQDPKARGALYAKEFKPRLAEGDDMPFGMVELMAANSLGTLAGTLISQRTLELFVTQLPLLSMISTDFSSEKAKLDQVVDARIVAIPAVQTYDPVTGWPDANVVTTDVPVTITEFKGVPITFNSNQLGGTVRRLFDEAAPAASYALASSFCDLVYTKMTAANFTNAPVVCSLIDFVKATLGAAAGVLNPLGVPHIGRYALLNTPYYMQLGNDTSLAYFAAIQSPEMVTDNKLPKMAGFDPVEVPNLPNTGNMFGFAGCKSALVISARLPADYTQAFPDANNGTVTTVTDAATGLSVHQVQYVNHQMGAATQRISSMFGAGVGDQRGGILFKSQ